MKYSDSILVTGKEVADLLWGARRKQPAKGWAATLAELVQAGEGKAFRIAVDAGVARNARRYQIRKAAKDMGLSVEFAETESSLYVRIKPAPASVAAAVESQEPGAVATPPASFRTDWRPLSDCIIMALRDRERWITIRSLLAVLHAVNDPVARKASEEHVRASLEAMVLAGRVLSRNEDGIWSYRLKDGRR